MFRILFLLFALIEVAVAEELLVPTAEGDEIPVQIRPAAGGELLIWLPSEFGVTPRHASLIATLAKRGIEVWTPDLHAAWFLPTGRYSLNEVDPAVVGTLLTTAIQRTGKRVFLVAEGRSAVLALNGVHLWQQATDQTTPLAGLIAFNPRLFARTPQGGEAAEYLPVVAASNLPIYLLQPQEAAGIWRVADDIAELQKGGSPVFVQTLPGVSDGFHARPDYSEAEQAMTARLPAILDDAMDLLADYGGTPSTPTPIPGALRGPERPDGELLLRPYPGVRRAPPLALPTLDGESVDLATLEGKVVLVNFWATWCPPCVKEIPSLQRLYHRLQPQGLEILAVDVGEAVETMQAFLADKPIEFPVLMDVDGEVLRRWGVYAFPTTLVLDRSHHIRYAVFGAFDWSSTEVIDTLTPLLDDRHTHP